jgi:diacylglycerol kinase (CTP)
MCVNIHSTVLLLYLTLPHLNSLSWADTAASTFGRLWGRHTPPLPSRVPILGLPLAPRKSLAGFLAASITGAAIVFSFWGWLVPAVGGAGPAWDWTGVSGPGVDYSPMGQSVKAVLRDAGFSGLPTGGWVGLAVISIVSGLVTGIAEALGASSFLHSFLQSPVVISI